METCHRRVVLRTCNARDVLPSGRSRVMTLDDMRRIVDVSEPQLSPDGRSVAVVVSRVNWNEDRRDSSIVLIDLASGAQRTLTHDRKDVASPRWSPSGDRLAFIDSVTDGDQTCCRAESSCYR